MKISPYVFVNYSFFEHENISVVAYTNSNQDLSEIEKKFGEFITARFPFINAVALTAPYEYIDKFGGDQCVSYVTGETIASVKMDIARAVCNTSIKPYSNCAGEGVTVAIIDTGIYPHIDFMLPTVRIKHFEDLCNGKTIAYDDNGHGTAVASAICGGGLVSGRRYIGIAPKVNLVVLKCMNAEGVAKTKDVLNAMQWVVDNKHCYDIDIVCMSFGANDLGYKDPFRLGATALWEAGITVCAAAGNSGDEKNTIKSPGTAQKVITVGALNDARTSGFSDDSIAKFSSRGPVSGYVKPDVVASGVGVNVASTLGLKGKFYTDVSGSSISTGIVAGICAIIIEKHGRIPPDEIKQILMRKARRVTGDANAEGAGAVML